MITTFTQHDIIRYVYNETSETESEHIKSIISSNAGQSAFYKDIKSMKGRLEALERTPSERVINNILNYSKSLSLSLN